MIILAEAALMPLLMWIGVPVIIAVAVLVLVSFSLTKR